MSTLFRKKTTLLDTKDREECARQEQLLKDAQIWCHTWSTEPMPVGGCGAKMRPTDWNGLRHTDRDAQRVVWHLEVLAEDEQRAKTLLAGRQEA